MPHLDRLPRRADGEAGLLAMARSYGDHTTFNLIRLCRTARSRDTDIAGAVLRALARRMVETYKPPHDGCQHPARQMVADELGYSPISRPNFYDLLVNAPTFDELPGEARPLTDLISEYGDRPVFEFIVMCRTTQSRATDIIGKTLVILAQRMVAEYELSHHVPYRVARQMVADQLGYSKPTEGNGRSHFYQLLTGGRSPEPRPRGGGSRK